jgi:hypothetical protein
MRRKIARRRRSAALPRTLALLFWDHPGQRLTLQNDSDLIIRRVLAEGGLQQVRLIRRRAGDAAIRDVLQRSRARGLSPQRIRFWQLLLGIPGDHADAWVRAARIGTWERRCQP